MTPQASASPNYFILTEDATITPKQPRTRVTRNSPVTGQPNTITVNACVNALNHWLQNEFDFDAGLPALQVAFPQLDTEEVMFITHGFSITETRAFIEEEAQAYAQAAQYMREYEYH